VRIDLEADGVASATLVLDGVRVDARVMQVSLDALNEPPEIEDKPQVAEDGAP
jgi:hypothetical protein